MTTSISKRDWRPDRRTILRGIGAGLLAGASGCSSPSGEISVISPRTVSNLLAQLPFNAAHRGGGGDWPEMTAYAYQQAVRLPQVQALEVSVCLSADGVLVCSHDPTLRRVTGVDVTVADQPWSALSRLQVRPTGTVDQGQPPRPLSRLEDVLDHLDDHVMFVEPKVPAAVTPLLDVLTRAGQPERVVWKSYITATSFTAAKQRGFATWGYVLDQPSHTGVNLARLASSTDIDLLGAPLEQDDAFVRAVVDAATRAGKKTMAWPVSTAAQRDRALALGCAGLMVSRPAELLGAGPN